jgi:hypothetical protein
MTLYHGERQLGNVRKSTRRRLFARCPSRKNIWWCPNLRFWHTNRICRWFACVQPKGTFCSFSNEVSAVRNPPKLQDRQTASPREQPPKRRLERRSTGHQGPDPIFAIRLAGLSCRMENSLRVHEEPLLVSIDLTLTDGVTFASGMKPVFVMVAEAENGSSGLGGSDTVRVTRGSNVSKAASPPIKVAALKTMASGEIRLLVLGAIRGDVFGLARFGALFDIGSVVYYVEPLPMSKIRTLPNISTATRHYCRKPVGRSGRVHAR